MRNSKCNDCGQVFQTNETFKVVDSVLCRACAEKAIASRKDIPKNQVRIQHDPTICANCGKDNGDIDLPTLAGLPACEQCITFLRNRPYPQWIKAAMVGLTAIVIFSFLWNWRFIRAYIDLRALKVALLVQDLDKAAKLSRSAATNVPESESVSTMASFFEGCLLLQQDKSTEALKLLTTCSGKLPPSYHLEELLARAEMGVAFDTRDYDKFLTLAIQYSEKNPNHSNALAQIASAYACKYAVTDDKQFKQQALDYLQKAKMLSKQQLDPNQFAEYEDRILYRIETREIITRNEFKKKFPSGWKRNLKEQDK